MEAFKIKSLDKLVTGERWEENVEITADLIDKFAALTGDCAPVHIDEEHAQAMGYPNRIAHGFLVTSMYSHILGMYLPGPHTVLHQVTTQMKEPAFIGDRLYYSVTVVRIIPALKAVLLSLKVTNQSGIIVNTGEATCVFRM